MWHTLLKPVCGDIKSLKVYEGGVCEGFGTVEPLGVVLGGPEGGHVAEAAVEDGISAGEVDDGGGVELASLRYHGSGVVARVVWAPCHSVHCVQNFTQISHLREREGEREIRRERGRHRWKKGQRERERAAKERTEGRKERGRDRRKKADIEGGKVKKEKRRRGSMKEGKIREVCVCSQVCVCVL